MAQNRIEVQAILNEVKAIDEKKISFEEFRHLCERILRLIPTDGTNEKEYLHRVENMALLGLTDNISLSNSVFEVKRRKIMEMERAGSFIPLATKRVFLKYYAANNTSHSVWTKDEREAYKNEIRKCVQQYKPINSETDEV